MPVNHQKNIIEVDNISFFYGSSQVLKDISLKIHQGDYLGIIGPNGSGKTTLLKVMLGLLKPAKGKIKLFGTDARNFKDWSKIAYVSQKVINFDALFPATVYEVVRMGRYGKDKKNDHETILDALKQVEMLEYRDRLIGDLSSGQQQRVFIARALAGNPEVIFLDEPTVGVDVKNQEKFYLLLRKLNQDLNITLILISHDIDVIANEVTEFACINQTVVYYGEPEKFFMDNYLEKLYGKNIKQILHQ